MNKSKLLFLVEIAIFAAIGFVLDQLSFQIWAQGGSISFVMVPIVLMAFRWGLAGGLTTGLLVGLLQVVAGGAKIYTPIQGFIDYFLAFTVVGLAALVAKQVVNAAKMKDKKRMIIFIVLGTTLGGILRFIAHTVSGIVFFAEYAGDQNVYWYSITYNASYMIPAIILTAIVVGLLFSSAPRLLEQKK